MLVICLHAVQISNSSIEPIDRTLSLPTRGDLGAIAMKGVLRIPQNPSITGASDC